MGCRRYYTVLCCIGAAALMGMAGKGEAKEEQNRQLPLLTEQVGRIPCVKPDIKDIWRAVNAEYEYIEGLSEVAGRVLQRLEAEKEAKDALVLFSRAKSLEGTTVFANVTNYVNVRKKATVNSEVVGKLYSGCVATVMEDAGDWVYVQSGNVKGYVVKEYLLFGEEAEAAIAKRYSPKVKVTANVLNIRAGAGTGYATLGTFTKGDTAELLQKGTEWIKIRFSSQGKSKTGYVYAKYVEITGEPSYGETLAEEKARLEKEKKEAEEAKKKAEAEKKAAAERAKREKAQNVANYAKTAVGTAYVWGGTNMKTGVDCSGLCYAAYKKYGYTLPRVSRDMAASSALLSVTPNTSHLKAGDLVFYASGGRVDHVAMYIGDGKIVHASDYDTGVIISRYNYRTPHSAKRVIY